MNSYFKILSVFLLGFVGAFATSCGTANIGEKYESKTALQQAKEKMNNGDYQGAIDILEPLADSEPEVYGRLPLLAAAYLAIAGIDLVSMLKNQITAGSGDSIFEQMGSFLPEGYTRTEVDLVDTGVQRLKRIPESLRGAEGDPEYGESALFQLILYEAIYSSMLVNLFIDVDINGDIDISKLEEMTLDDVRSILSSLASAQNNAAAGSNISSEAIGETLDEIEATEGDDDREKLINYIGSN